jgi:hypothetical protein
MATKDSRKSSQTASLQALQELLSTAERSLHHAKNIMVQITGKKPAVLAETPDMSGLHAYKHGKSQVVE